MQVLFNVIRIIPSANLKRQKIFQLPKEQLRLIALSSNKNVSLPKVFGLFTPLTSTYNSRPQTFAKTPLPRY
ncbi:MAG: hypothetical protein MZV70_11560 [Desulfobacterales bacterium]|nr:hypothetical protein [Desulfobacterales bacterium]